MYLEGNTYLAKWTSIRNSNRQAGAVYTFDKSNVMGGQFKYQSSSTRKRINQVRVTWNDPTNSYKQSS